MVLAGSQAPGQLPVNGAVCGRGAEVIHDSAAQRTTSWRKRIGGGVLLFYFFCFYPLPVSVVILLLSWGITVESNAKKQCCLSQEVGHTCDGWKLCTLVI